LRAWTVVGTRRESVDATTLIVRPASGDPFEFLPAQFSMLGVPGVGEAPISISSPTFERDAHRYTVRAVGAVTSRLVSAGVGDVVTVRGPFGRPWDLDAAAGRRALFVAGGIGIAPLRAAIHELLEGYRRHPDVRVVVGAVEPAKLVFRDWLESLRDTGSGVEMIVDRAPEGSRWSGRLGLVTELLPAMVESSNVEVYVCGPDPMMVAVRRQLEGLGVARNHVQFTLERNMQCGTGTCGHCQLGPVVVCRDGPVLRADEVDDLLEVAEL
jgi:NAD(P)H-flavin reductase